MVHVCSQYSFSWTVEQSPSTLVYEASLRSPVTMARVALFAASVELVRS